MSKRIHFIWVLYVGSIFSCPTCVGRIAHHNKSPFFSDEHYTTQNKQPEDIQTSSNTPQQSSADSLPNNRTQEQP